MYFRRKGDRDRTEIAIKFMWTPGVKPVIIPRNTPINIARNISIIIGLIG